MTWLDADAEKALVRIRDLAGRARGTGFLADHRGTVVTSHEAVDGLTRMVLQPLAHSATGGASGGSFEGSVAEAVIGGAEPARLVSTDAVTPLPGFDLALVRSDGFGFPRLSPLPVAAARPAAGTRVRFWAGSWLEGTVVGAGPGVTYTATELFHPLDETLELALCARGREALRLGGVAAGGPVLDARTGAVLGLLGAALHSGSRADGFAIPLRAAAETTPRNALAALLQRNAETVPAYGSELNLAGVLHLSGISSGPAGQPRGWRDPVERPEAAREFALFGVVPRERNEAGDQWEEPQAQAKSEATAPRGRGGRAPLVLGLVGEPGTGRSTELTALAERRAQSGSPAPTLRLRGADLRAGDEGLRAAVDRALCSAGRTVAMSGGTVGDAAGTTTEAVTRQASAAGRPLLVLLDGPEEMPTSLARDLREWTGATTEWLSAANVRLVLACRPEYWERAGALFPPARLHRPSRPHAASSGAPPWALPPCVRLGDLAGAQAERARSRYGLPSGAQAASDAGHPLALRLLAEVRAALPKGDVRRAGGVEDAEGVGREAGAGDRGGVDAAAAPDRHEIFDAYLDLLCLRIAVRLAAAQQPSLRGTSVRRLAARVAGQVHEAARRCLGPGQGELDEASFGALFPSEAGWDGAVRAEGLLTPAGSGYRFTHEELGEWLQGAHLDVDAALSVLVHRAGRERGEDAGRVGGCGASQEEPFARLSSQGVGVAGGPAAAVPVPGHRIGPVVQALLLLARREGTGQLTRRLAELVPVVTAPAAGPRGGRYADAQWWATRLLSGVLLRVPDATPYAGVLRLLADRITERAVSAGGFAHTGLEAFGPWFWRLLPLAEADRMDLLRRLLPADGPPAVAVGPRAAGSAGRRGEAGPVGRRAGMPERLGAGGARSAPAGSGAGRARKSPVGAAAERPEGVARSVEPRGAEGCSVAELYTEAWAEEGRRAGVTDGNGPRAGAAVADGSRAGVMDEAGVRRSGGTGADGRSAGGGRPEHGSGGGRQGRPSVELGEAEGAPGRAHRVHPPRTSPEAAPAGPTPTPRGATGRGEGTADAWASFGVGGAADEPSEPVRGRPARPFARPPRVRVHTADSLHRPAEPPWERPREWPREPASDSPSGAVTGPVSGAGRGPAGERAPQAAARDADERASAEARPRGVEGTRESSPTSVSGAGVEAQRPRLAPPPPPAPETRLPEAAPAGVPAPATGPSATTGPTAVTGATGAVGPERAAGAATAEGPAGAPVATGASASAEAAAPPAGSASAPEAADRPDPDRPDPVRFLDLVADLLRADPERTQPLLCAWFDDRRPLQTPGRGGATLTPSASQPGRVSAGAEGRVPQQPTAVPARVRPAPRRITVAAAAQALLHTHRRQALDALADTLADAAHPGAQELLEALAEDEPSAVCRAVDRWAYDERSERRATAAALALRVAPYAVTDTDQALLRYAALASLARPADASRHGAALTLLVRDPSTRSQFIDRALACFAAGAVRPGAPQVPPEAFAGALHTHPEPVLDAFLSRLLDGDGDGGDGDGGRGDNGDGSGDRDRECDGCAAGADRGPCSAEAVLRVLADAGGPAAGAPAPEGPAVTGPVLSPPTVSAPQSADLTRRAADLTRRAAELIRAYARRRPEHAARHLARFVDRRLEDGPDARAALRPLTVELLTGPGAAVRCALAPVLARAGASPSARLRRELLDVLLASEAYDAPPPGHGSPYAPRGGGPARVAGHDTRVLEALLRAAAEGARRRPADHTRELVHRVGMLLVRTPEGAACFDRRLVELGRQVPGFARRVQEWVASAPGDWAAVVGPSARVTLAGCRS